MRCLLRWRNGGSFCVELTLDVLLVILCCGCSSSSCRDRWLLSSWDGGQDEDESTCCVAYLKCVLPRLWLSEDEPDGRRLPRPSFLSWYNFDPGGGTDAMIALAMDAVANSDDEWTCLLCSDGAVNAHWVVDAVAYWIAMITASAAIVRTCRRGGSSLLIVLTLWPIVVSIVWIVCMLSESVVAWNIIRHLKLHQQEATVQQNGCSSLVQSQLHLICKWFCNRENEIENRLPSISSHSIESKTLLTLQRRSYPNCCRSSLSQWLYESTFIAHCKQEAPPPATHHVLPFKLFDWVIEIVGSRCSSKNNCRSLVSIG